jgi:L-iditol 2-dehydrogenase
MGLRRIAAVDPVEFRRATAARTGASLALHPAQDLGSEVRNFNDGRHADIAVVATGAADGLETARKVLGRHGTIVLFGASHPGTAFPFSINQLFWRNEFNVVSSYGPGNASFSKAIQLVNDGKIDAQALITDCLPFSAVQEGFGIVARAQRSLKVVLDVAAE